MVASLLKPIHVGVGVAPLLDPPSDDHYQPPTGPTAALSGSKAGGPTAALSGSETSKQTHRNAEPCSVSEAQSRKRKAHSIKTPPSKRSRVQDESSSSSSTSSDSSIGELITPFDPASLVKSKEGTFKAPAGMTKFMRKHFKRCMPKEQGEAFFKEHPRPDVEGMYPTKGG